MTDKIVFAIGAFSGALGVVLGAFGAHALRSRLEPAMLEIWKTAVQYHLYHALALLAVAWAAQRFPEGPWRVAGICFALGTVVFSGSLYALALTGMRWLGAITPLGGLLFIAGWIALALCALKG